MLIQDGQSFPASNRRSVHIAAFQEWPGSDEPSPLSRSHRHPSRLRMASLCHARQRLGRVHQRHHLAPRCSQLEFKPTGSLAPGHAGSRHQMRRPIVQGLVPKSYWLLGRGAASEHSLPSSRRARQGLPQLARTVDPVPHAHRGWPAAGRRPPHAVEMVLTVSVSRAGDLLLAWRRR
jgi:hypothetical protein